MTTPALGAGGPRAACLPRRRTGNSDVYGSVGQEAGEPRATPWPHRHHSMIQRDGPLMPPAGLAVVRMR